jgi:PAS domain S-box-containing protein
MPPATEVIQVATPRVEARLVVDANGHIYEANPALHRLLGHQPGTLVGLSLAWIMPPSQHTMLGELKRAFHDVHRVRLLGTLMAEDGSLLPVIMLAEPCMVAGGRRLVLWVEPDAPTIISQRALQSLPRSAQLASMSHANALPRPAIVSLNGSHAATASTTPLSPPPAPAPSSPPHVRDAQGSPVFAHAPEGALGPEFIESLAACRELLRWLDGQLQHQSTPSVPRNGRLAAVVLDEASALLDQCRAALCTLRETTDSGLRRPPGK